jgi:dTDP-4-amino-4,6-dideoxygalactose transaminase
MSFPQIPLFDLRLDDEDVEAVLDVLRSGWLTMGPKTAEFEAAFADHLGVRHAVAVSSCTAALHLAYLAAGVGPGDEVIVPAMTFAATAAAALYCGATPVFAEIAGPHDLSLDPADVERKITDRTKAVCVVHFAGYPAAVRELLEVCGEIPLIEDVAHAPYAHVDGRALGSFGLAGAFSFFSNKVLACGEGGLLATDDDAVAEQARLLRSQGMTSGTWSRHTGQTETYDAVAMGFNYRLDEPRSALLLSRLKRLPAGIERRRALTRRYREKLRMPGLIVPYADEAVADSTCYVMPVLVEDATRRDAVRRHLRDEHGVQTSVFYPAVHEFTAYRERYGADLPQTEFVARAEITLPLFPDMTEAMQDRVVDALREAL